MQEMPVYSVRERISFLKYERNCFDKMEFIGVLYLIPFRSDALPVLF